MFFVYFSSYPQCAILSPAFKVREFSITDVVPYSISLKWNSAAEEGLRYDLCLSGDRGNTVWTLMFASHIHLVPEASTLSIDIDIELLAFRTNFTFQAA